VEEMTHRWIIGHKLNSGPQPEPEPEERGGVSLRTLDLDHASVLTIGPGMNLESASRTDSVPTGQGR